MCLKRLIVRFQVIGLYLGIMTPSLFALDLVKDGKPAGEFIISSEAHKAIRFSVADVAYWIKEMTGCSVPVLTESSLVRNTKIYIGKEFAKAWHKDLTALTGTDGYAIRNQNNNVYVFGDRPRGTLYGVFGLLERNSDIIWARPNRHFGTIFGKTRSLVLTHIDLIDKPVFPVRRQGGHFRPYHQDTLDWQIRNLANQTLGPNLELDMIAHYHDIPYWLLARTLKDKNYLEKYPEIFAYVDKYKKRVGNGVCYMNPKLDDIYFKELMNRINQKEKSLGRKINYINSHMGDSWQCCECELCLKPIKLADGSFLKPQHPSSYKDLEFRSTQYYMFYSRIMERLKKVHPDLNLCVLAYIYSAAVPHVAPHPDLQIIFAPYPTSNMHFAMLDPRQPALWRNRYNGWLKITRRLGMREYYNASTIAPISLTCQQDLKTLITRQDKDNIVIVTETRDDITLGIPGWDLATMEMWIINRLFWNPTQGMAALRRQFIERTYREAAPAMTRYYDIIRDSWLEPDDKTVCGWHVSPQYIYDNLIVRKGLEKKCLQALQDALKTVKHPNSRIMIERIYHNLRSVNQNMGKLMVAQIPEMFQDGDTFESIQWEKPLEMTEFKQPFLYKVPNSPSQATQIKAGHDGRNLYVRFDASDSDITRMDAETSSAPEVFLKGDHIEFWLYQGVDNYIFAFNGYGCKYDAKNLNKGWNSNWMLTTRKTNVGWNAIITLPLQDFGLVPGKQTALKWSALRKVKHKGEEPEISVYKGMSLHYKKYPVVIE